MKKYIVLGLLFIIALTSCLKHVSDREKREFADSMATALHLKFINTDPEYASPYFRIYNDTIVGFHTGSIDNKEYYFVQSIKNLKFNVITGNDSLRHPSISPIDAFKDGRLYFGRFGRSTMQTLDLDENLTEYFRKYEDTLSYANKVMLYKNMAVITSMTGVYVFEVKSQKLLWKYRYTEIVNNGMNGVLGNKLVFTETVSDTVKGVYTNIVCFDLDKLKRKWVKTLNNSKTWVYAKKYVPRDQLYSDSNEVIIPQGDACYRLDLNTGSVKGKFLWSGYFRNDPRFTVENGRLYLDNQHTLVCIDLTTGKKIWQVKNAVYWEFYKNYVIACTPDIKFYLIVNKFTGKIESKIPKPDNYTMDFDVVGKYVLINLESLYQ